MKIAITSGKGGSGKTLIATNLAKVLSNEKCLNYIDCDVEAPNGHLFIKPAEIESKSEQTDCIISVDMDKCVLCGKCAKTCYSNAILAGRENIMVFPELCRYCGACEVVCKEQALVKDKRVIGESKSGSAENINISWAELATGAGGMTVRLINNLTSQASSDLTILDSPPGTSCPVVNTVQDADIVILAADPTVFGMHDLKLSVGMCRSLGINPLIIINRVGIGDIHTLTDWCHSEKLEIIGELPDDRQIAEHYSRGELVAEHMPEINKIFVNIAEKIMAHQSCKIESKANNSGIFLAEPQTRKSAVQSVENNGACEIAVLSGKGGSGKTSIAACLTQLVDNIAADCDVDAADMHLLLKPEINSCSEFIGGKVMQIDNSKCHPCGDCKYICQFNAVERTGNYGYTINESSCEGCGACLELCPRNAIYSKPSVDGRMYMSTTRFGNLSHATLEPGLENSGKLVTTVRSQATAAANGGKIIIDGSPGTGCPVIASVGGVKFAVLVAEPTVSGLHDLKRIYDLCRYFKVPTGIIINKSDLNSNISAEIEQYANKNNIAMLGKLIYSNVFNSAQQAGQTILEYDGGSDIAENIRIIFNNINKELTNNE